MSYNEGEKVTMAMDGNQAGLQSSKSSDRHVAGVDHLGPVTDNIISVEDLIPSDINPPKQKENSESEGLFNTDSNFSNDELVACVAKLIEEVKIFGYTIKKDGKAKLSQADMGGLLPLMNKVAKTAQQ